MPTILDPYATLGVSPTATQAEIDKAYRRRQLLFHPDRTVSRSKTEQETAAEILRDVLSAYAIIGNPRLRALHDAQSKTRDATAAPPPPPPRRPQGPPMWPAAAPPPQPAAGTGRTGPAPSATSGAAAPGAEKTTTSPTGRTHRPTRDGPSAARILVILGGGLLVVGPVAQGATSRLLPFVPYNARWILGFVVTVAFVVIALRRAVRGTEKPYDLPTAGPAGAASPSATYRFDEYYDDYGHSPSQEKREKKRAAAEEYTRRTERERHEAAQRAHWERAEREAANARREAERHHREQRIRQARMDKERQRQYNRTHPFGHR